LIAFIAENVDERLGRIIYISDINIIVPVFGYELLPDDYIAVNIGDLLFIGCRKDGKGLIITAGLNKTRRQKYQENM